MDNLVRDLRHAARALARAPGFTAAAAVALALGVGGSTAIFSVLDAVVLRPLAVPHADRLVRLYVTTPIRQSDSFSPLDYLDLAKENGAFEAVAATSEAGLSITTAAGPMRLEGARVTASFFATLRVQPALGRALSPDEDLRGPPPVAILTDKLWRREFSADPQVLGRSLTIDGQPHTVVGVLPADFDFAPLEHAEVLVPFAFDAAELKNRGFSYLDVVGRLGPGVSLAQAQADLDVVGPRIASRHPEHAGRSMRAVPLLADLVGPVKGVLQALLGAVLLVLLMACANVASMLLARGAARQREMAIRAALGSSRAGIVRQLLVESLLLALLGGALGVLLAAWGVGTLVALAPRSIPRLSAVQLDRPVLVFALLLSLASGVIAGLLPALQVSRSDLTGALKNGGGGLSSRTRARSALVVAEVAVALMLVVGAGLMMRTLRRLLDVPTGLGDPAHVLVADVDLPAGKYDNDQRIVGFQREVLERVSALPGVKSAALLSSVPLDLRFGARLGLAIEGEPPPVPGRRPSAEVVWATPGYAPALGIPLLRGRDLAPTDTAKAPLAVLVNQTFVRAYLGGGEGVGRRITHFREDDEAFQIVGVLADVRTRGLDRAPLPLIVVPLAQWPVTYLRIAVRAAGPPLDLLPLVRAQVLAVDKDQPLSRARVLERVVDESTGQRRFQRLLLTVFGAVALLLAALGIYGVMAYSVAQRSREFGIRMALGAEGSQVRRLVLRGGLRLSLLGVAIGAAGALLVTRALQTSLFEVSASDPTTFAAVAALLLAVALVASWVPAHRATRTDPMIPLRAE